MTGEVVDCHTELCILWTPLVLSPAVTVVVVCSLLAGEALEALREWSGFHRWFDVVEVDAISCNLVTYGHQRQELDSSCEVQGHGE